MFTEIIQAAKEAASEALHELKHIRDCAVEAVELLRSIDDRLSKIERYTENIDYNTREKR